MALAQPYTQTISHWLSIYCRSVSSSRSQSQNVNADTRSVHTMSTIVDDVDKPDEADETSSFRSMSSTTSTNYGAPKPRPSTTPLYTIPDEGAASEDDNEEESNSQSETEAARDLPASAAAQALHQEADDLVLSRQHASSSDGSADHAPGSENKSHVLGSGGSFSEASELCPVSETESSRRTASNGNYDEGSHIMGHNTPSSTELLAETAQRQPPNSHTHQASSAASAGTTPLLSVSTTNQHEADSPLSQSPMATDNLMPGPESMHTPRTMGPPAMPGAPLVPKIDAGPAPNPPSDVEQLHVATDTDFVEGQTMFAGLDIM